MSDLIALALIKRLYSEGLLDQGDIAAIADEVEPHDKMGAHQVRVQMLEVEATPQGQWEAEQNRARFHVIDGGNGD